MMYMIPMLNTIYSGMSGRGALLNSSIYASSGLVLGCGALILLVLGIACIDVRIMLPHSRAELHDDTFVALKCTVSRG